ncbi:ABC transporter ATP-binding protein [Herbaspirillum sp. ST 5-3]|uniref:ABC transporter ATP-binding protein n=1 Tax=Oxalobacteraceae TaxID=75682 RepID=UPI0010A41946|nr:ABC transporter ATP-binding protein [Herbaspirillum sp. ST 5-3]
MKPILEVCDLTKRFGGLVAVRNVSFSVRRGEIVGILGPNGAGKTTLFNLLTGFMAPDQGSVEFNGKPLQKQPPYRVVNMGLARTFQLCRPFVGMSVLENVMVACYSPRGARHGTIHGESPENRSRKILGDVGLGHKIDMSAELLSYGDQRRLEIARALATEPELLLLDEPFAGLGSSEIEPLSELIRHLHRERGLTILIIEHKLREFMQLVQSVIAIDFGEVIATGSPEDIVRHPKVVEAYIGKTEADLGIA